MNYPEDLPIVHAAIEVKLGWPTDVTLLAVGASKLELAITPELDVLSCADAILGDYLGWVEDHGLDELLAKLPSQ